MHFMSLKSAQRVSEKGSTCTLKCTLCTEKSRHVLNKKLTAENRQRKQGKQNNPMKIK